MSTATPFIDAQDLLLSACLCLQDLLLPEFDDRREACNIDNLEEVMQLADKAVGVLNSVGRYEVHGVQHIEGYGEAPTCDSKIQWPEAATASDAIAAMFKPLRPPHLLKETLPYDLTVVTPTFIEQVKSYLPGSHAERMAFEQDILNDMPEPEGC